MKKYRKTRWAVLTAFVLSSPFITSCSQVAGLGVVSEKQSKFDGEKEVNMSPAIVVGTEFKTNYPLLGASWSEGSPNSVILIIEHRGSISGGSGYSNIRTLEINVDGKFYKYTPRQYTAHSNSGYNNVSRTIYTQSRNVVSIPLSLAKRMVSAEVCMLRTSTSDGVFEQNFAKESNMGTATAKSSMRKFLAKVEATH